MDTELQPINNSLTINELKTQIGFIQEMMSDILKNGEHYGVIPGTKKPTLFKAGAEKLCFALKLTPTIQTEVIDLGNGHREYRSKCSLVHRVSGEVMSVANGSCSTMESKYRWRMSQPECPHCGKDTINKSKADFGGGWYCWTKKGGCGANFDKSENFSSEKIENKDIADCWNTVLKMAEKRALVASVLIGTAASDLFTQDMEDFRGYSQTAEKKVSKNKYKCPVDLKEITDHIKDLENKLTTKDNPVRVEYCHPDLYKKFRESIGVGINTNDWNLTYNIAQDITVLLEDMIPKENLNE